MRFSSSTYSDTDAGAMLKDTGISYCVSAIKLNLTVLSRKSLLTFLSTAVVRDNLPTSFVIRILYPSNNLRCCRLKPGYSSYTTHSLRKDDHSLPSEGPKEPSAPRHKTRLRLYEISSQQNFLFTTGPSINIKIVRKVNF
jgi:hypothetical protein